MDEQDNSLCIQQHVRRSRVDLEGLRHPTVFVVRARKEECPARSFYEPFNVRSRVGESNRDETQLRRLVAR